MKTRTEDQLVTEYFAQIDALRNGVDTAVENLSDMWDADGVFEFCGSPPLAAKYVGRTAIKTLYKNRFHANGMEVPLDQESSKLHKCDEVTVTEVKTDVKRIRPHDGKLVAGWSTRIGTHQGLGFSVSGSHTFTFRDGRITNLKVVISPKADDAKGLKLDGLTTNDIGRLALAAWPVV
jgi:ketosteroid isomerase-like protein